MKSLSNLCIVKIQSSLIVLDQISYWSVVKADTFFFSPVLRKSKEEYDEEMSRRLLLDEEVGSTSSSCTDKPMAEGREAQNTTSAPSQQSNTAKVMHLDLFEPNKTCGPAKPRNPWRIFVCERHQQNNLWYGGMISVKLLTVLSLLVRYLPSFF